MSEEASFPHRALGYRSGWTCAEASLAADALHGLPAIPCRIFHLQNEAGMGAEGCRRCDLQRGNFTFVLEEGSLITGGDAVAWSEELRSGRRKQVPP